jgi:hypothetical protein
MSVLCGVGVLIAAPAFAATPPQPFTLAVGAWAPCATDSSDIRPLAEADVAAIQRAAGHVDQDSLTNPTEAELRGRLTLLSARGALRHGLVVVYSGHGAATHPTSLDSPPDATAQPPLPPRDGTSYLCLPSGWLKVETLLEQMDSLRPAPPWVVLVLNACESAFVDVSRSALPVSVISASAYPVAVHSRENATSASELVRATAQVIAQPAAHDSNHDGLVDDSELLMAIRGLIASWRPLLGNPGRPWPKLRRQASAALPVRRHQQSPIPEAALAVTIEKLRQSGPAANELVGALDAQLALGRGETRLPSLAWDFVVAEGSQRSRDTKADSLAGALATRSDLRALPEGVALTPAEMKRLGAFMNFANIYVVREEAPWTEIVRLADGHVMATTRARSLSAALPARMALAARWQSGYWLVRATGAVVGRGNRACWSGELCRELAEMVFALCREEEGQCFMVK